MCTVHVNEMMENVELKLYALSSLLSFVARSRPSFLSLLSTTLVARDKTPSHPLARKKVQVRRTKVAEIWDASGSNLSFKKLLSVAAGFVAVKENDGKGLEAFLAKAKATYLDEDGDEVRVSSDEELKDAFLQVLAALPVRKPLLIAVTFPRIDKPAPLPAAMTTATAAAGMPKRIPIRKFELPAKKSFSVVSIGKSPSSPLIAAPAAAAVAVGGCRMRNDALRITPRDFENKFFVHPRHTCDGCSTSPIVGTRYHAAKIPDFDLCESCFERYEGDDLDFRPEIQGECG